VAEQINGDGLEALLKNRDMRLPTGDAAGEAVQKDERQASAGQFDVQMNTVDVEACHSKTRRSPLEA
jgi:hypothetical protein